MAETAEHTKFIQNLAISCQVLSCVHLLCDFQVLASVPCDEEIACEDVADIVGLPEGLLRAVVGMTASVGFLRIPKAGYVAHSTISSQLSKDAGALDAFAFLAETLSPCAIRMPETTRWGAYYGTYSMAFGEGSDYASAVQHDWRLQRQAKAHSRLTMTDEGDPTEQRSGLLGCLDWTSLGSATVVDVDAPSPALAIKLATEYNSLCLVVEGNVAPEDIPSELRSRIRLLERPPFTQPVQDASVYIIHLISPSITRPVSHGLLDGLAGQLALHIPILRHHPLARIILLARVLPEVVTSPASKAGNADSSQALALYHNMALHQLVGARDHERANVLACVHRTCDTNGVLVVTNEVRGTVDPNLIAFEIQYLATALGSYTPAAGDSCHDTGGVAMLS